MNQREKEMVNFCIRQSYLSKCKDKQNAAILVSADFQQIYSIGINGGPIGGMQCLCFKNRMGEKAKYTCAHAEMNCLVKNTEISEKPKVMICTQVPCQMCATLIVNAKTNIIQVWYINDHPDETGKTILSDGGIILRKIDIPDLTGFFKGEWCDTQAVCDRLNIPFEIAITMFDFSSTVEWWSMIGKTDEERKRNGQKVTTQFRIRNVIQADVPNNDTEIRELK